MSDDGLDDDDEGERFGDDDAEDIDELFVEFNEMLFRCRLKPFMFLVGLTGVWIGYLNILKVLFKVILRNRSIPMEKIFLAVLRIICYYCEVITPVVY